MKKNPAKTLEYQEFANVWDALCDTPEEAANLTARSELMMQITRIVKTNHPNRQEERLDPGGGGKTLPRHPAPHERSPARPHRSLLPRRARQYCHRPRPQSPT